MPFPGTEAHRQLLAAGEIREPERWARYSEPGVVTHEQGAEWFVLSGEIGDDEGVYGPGSWLRFPVGATHRPRSAKGCTLYLKLGGLRYLESAAA